MGLTLFRYIFKDLLKVFLLASLSVAGILSFAGLMRPLTERGLGAAEAVRILVWLLPAMLSYSLPVAALFATTFVYGRMSADNEAVAAKAAGIPAAPGGLLTPAVVLSALLGVASFGLLCFVVPAANLQVEQAIWSNLAKLAANNINRTSRVNFESDAGSVTVFAERAVLPTPEQLDALRAAHPEAALSEDVQVVQLQNAYVIRYESAEGEDGEDVSTVPEEIYAARSATVFIDPPSYARGATLLNVGKAFEQSALSADQFATTVVLDDGVKFPRRLGLNPNPTTADAGGGQPTVAAARSSQFGPILRETPLRLNPKFMDVRELRGMLDEPDSSRRITSIVRRFAREDQRSGFLVRLGEQAAAEGGVTLEASDGSRFLFTAGGAGRVKGTLNYARVPLQLVQERPVGDGRVERIVIDATEASIEAEPLGGDGDADPARVLAVFTFPSATVTIDDGRPLESRPIERRAIVPMDADLAALSHMSGADYLAGRAAAVGGNPLSPGDASFLLSKRAWQTASVIGELHARWAFVVACVLLPLLGAGLGLLFRSANYLAAFAISMVPAGLCIILIVVGQQFIEQVPDIGPEELADPSLVAPSLAGFAMIWGGNAFVALGGAALLWRIRQR